MQWFAIWLITRSLGTWSKMSNWMTMFKITLDCSWEVSRDAQRKAKAMATEATKIRHHEETLKHIVIKIGLLSLSCWGLCSDLGKPGVSVSSWLSTWNIHLMNLLNQELLMNSHLSSFVQSVFTAECEGMDLLFTTKEALVPTADTVITRDWEFPIT